MWFLEIACRNKQKPPPKVFYKRDVPKNYAKLTGKNLFQSLFFNEVADLRFIILKRKAYHFRNPCKTHF